MHRIASFQTTRQNTLDRSVLRQLNMAAVNGIANLHHPESTTLPSNPGKRKRAETSETEGTMEDSTARVRDDQFQQSMRDLLRLLRK